MDSIRADVRRGDPELFDRRTSPGRDILPSAVIACAERLSASLDIIPDRDAIRAAVREFAQQVRAQNVPPERALAAFKFMVFNLPALSTREPEERVSLMADVTRMSIEEYYAE
ncbi:MAG TPA: hypothetical protein VEB19_05510 [Gemmatimonadaceae bacterium]|nr:hypothetical protein [Gemmatimonadaceae bacterium]